MNRSIQVERAFGVLFISKAYKVRPKSGEDPQNGFYPDFFNIKAEAVAQSSIFDDFATAPLMIAMYFEIP